jgi:molybdopterin synthase sulfur carrier subunit
MEIKVYATLRDIVGGGSIHLNGVSEITVEKMLQQMFAQFPDLKSEFYKSDGEMHSAIHILINGRDMRYINGWETRVTDKDVVRIFPPVGGGLG